MQPQGLILQTWKQAHSSGHGSANPRGQSPLPLRISLSSNGPSRRERDRHTAAPAGLLSGAGREMTVRRPPGRPTRDMFWMGRRQARALLLLCPGWDHPPTSSDTRRREGRDEEEGTTCCPSPA